MKPAESSKSSKAAAAKPERLPVRVAVDAPPWAEAYEACKMEVAVCMGRFFVEHLMRLHREFDGDLEQVILLGEIGHHNASRLRYSADGGLDGRGADGEVNGLVPCNAFSLSQATGIPRETVRRKIAKLTRRGWVRSNERSEVFVTPAAAAHFTPVFNRETLNGLFAVTAELEALLRGAAAAQAAEKAGGRAGAAAKPRATAPAERRGL